MNEPVLSQTVDIFPNPVSSILSCEIHLERCKAIEISDLFGREVLNIPFEKIFQSPIGVNVEMLPAAAYFIRFLFDDRTITRMFVKE
jgi:hypothetical protein